MTDPERMRAFLEAHVLPLEPAFLADRHDEVDAGVGRAREVARASGLWCPHLPASLGGMGLSLVALGEVGAVLGRSPLGHLACNCNAPDAGNMELLHRAGTPDQQERWLHPLAQGLVRSCFGMTEPEHPGSNPVWMSTRAERDGDGWRVTGHKWFTTGADGASFCVVMAVTDPDGPPHARATMFVVPTDAPGFTKVRDLPVMGAPSRGPASHAEVRLDDVWVPDADRLGPVGAGFRLAQERLGPGRIHHCMRWIGIAERALDLLVARARQRELAPGAPLGNKQLVQSWIATSYARIRAARLLVLDTAARIEQVGARAARVDVAAIKLHTAQVMLDVVDHALQAHGGAGMLDEGTPLAWWYRHERAARIYDGADEVHVETIARALLGAP